MSRTRVGELDGGDPTLNPEPIRLRAFVLLAGSLRAKHLPSLLGRSVLDLPLSAELRLLDLWRLRIQELAAESTETSVALELLVMVGASNPVPTFDTKEGGLRIRAAQDENDYRGTAGLLRDVAHGFDDDEYVLVGNASQCPDPGLLRRLVREAKPSDSVTLLAGADRVPTGLMIVRCGALNLVPEVGYIDLKEQALPRFAAEGVVRVVVGHRRASRPIRNLESYVDVLRSWHTSDSLVGIAGVSPFEERWEPAFAVVEAGAHVADDVRLHDSVILSGGRVEPGCELVRTVVAPGGVVLRNRFVIDQLVLDQREESRAGRRRSSGGKA